MICKNCGRELLDTDKFCPACGTVVDQEVPVYVETTATQPASAPKKKGVNLIALAAVALVVVVAAVVLLSGVFASDAQALAKAVAKSGEAYAEAMNDMELMDAATYKGFEEACSVDMNVDLVDVVGAEELNGIGLDVRMDYSKPQQHMGMTLVPNFASVDLLEAQLQVKGTELYVGVPQLTGSTYYMIRTDILGRELSALGANMEGAEDMGFNIFELMDKTAAITAKNQERMKAAVEVIMALGEQVQVEKTGKETIDVNGTQMDAKVYHVLIPQQCVTEALDAMEPVYMSAYSNDAVFELYAAMGMPEETISIMKENMDQTNAYAAESYAELREIVAELGDLELDMYVSGGRVAAVTFTIADEDVTVDFRIALGGGENYVDNISITGMDQNGEGILINFQGDYGAKGGAYTSHMEAQIVEAGEAYTVASWDLRYAPAEQADNFAFTMEVDEEMTISLKGLLSCGKEVFLMDLDEISVYSYGEKMGTFAMEYRVGAYAPEQVDTTSHMILAEMTDADMQNAMNEISGNAMTWLTWLQENCPDLLAMLM